MKSIRDYDKACMDYYRFQDTVGTTEEDKKKLEALRFKMDVCSMRVDMNTRDSDE